VKKVRGGGLFRHGANGHRRALKKYKEAQAAQSQPQVQKFGS
jgi:hypothetical protein